MPVVTHAEPSSTRTVSKLLLGIQHSIRYTYLFIYGFVLINIGAGLIQSVLTTGLSALPNWEEIQKTYLFQIASLYPIFFWPLGVIIVLIGITGPFIDNRIHTTAEFAQRNALTTHVTSLVQQMIGTPLDFFHPIQVQDLRLVDFKQGSSPIVAYFERPQFTSVRTVLQRAAQQQSGGVILVGPPMVGKTRMLLEALCCDFPEYLLLSWRSSFLTAQDLIRVANELAGQSVVLFLDDLHELARQPEEGSRIAEFASRIRRVAQTIILVGTTRPGSDEDAALTMFESLIELFAVKIIQLEPMDSTDERNRFLAFAKEQENEDNVHLSIDAATFDGTPGSLLLGLGRRVVQLRSPDFLPAAQALLKALALLHDAQIAPASEARVRRVANALFALPDDAWEGAVTYLERNAWIVREEIIATDTVIRLPSDAYLEVCLPQAMIYPIGRHRIADDYPRLAQLFMTFPHDIPALYLLSEALRRDRLGKKAEQIELAVQCVETALEGLENSIEWAEGQFRLGRMYNVRIRGDAATNYEQAITAYQNALTIFTQQNTPLEWAAVQNALGLAYRKRIKGDHTQNIENAIGAFRAALSVRTSDAFPAEWANTQTNLGFALEKRILGDQHQNAVDAIAIYRAVLNVRTQATSQYGWATLQNDLGLALFALHDANREQHIEDAIIAFQRALTVRTKDAAPVKWATTQHNLGVAYEARLHGDRQDNLEQALVAFRQALQVRTFEAFPIQHARSLYRLGSVLRQYKRGDQSAHQEEAIELLMISSNIITEALYPLDWARRQYDLGLIYQERLIGAREDNLAQALLHFLRVAILVTPDEDINLWIGVQHNLALTYGDLARAAHMRGEDDTALRYQRDGQTQVGKALTQLTSLISPPPTTSADFQALLRDLDSIFSERG